jgi:putative FmdB family regulatory protein
MPTYPYECKDCAHKFDIVKTVSRIDEVEQCPSCNSDKTGRYLTRFHFYGASDWDKAEYNPGLGMVIRNKRHRRDEAKARGMIEIGNEDPDKTHAHYEKQREKQSEDSWAKIPGLDTP